MSKVGKKILEPELRFPEFRDNGEWEENKLINLASTVTPPKKLPTEQYNEKGRYPIIDQSQSYICGWTNDEDSLIKSDFPLIVFGNHTCALKLVRKPFAQGSGGIKILRSKDQVDLEFLYHSLQFNPVVMEAYKNHFPILKEKLVGFPKKESGEQQKIADCLSSIDELIATQTQKLDALKIYKKGLMQQLFPADGEILPKLRFPDFRNEWDCKKISDFAKVTTGNKDTQNRVDDGEYPFFVRSQTVERIDSYAYEGKAILTSGDGVGVGKNFHYIEGKFNFHQRVYCIYDFVSAVCGQFVYQYFSEHFYKRAMRMSAKSSVDSVRMPMITEMPIRLPSLEEQQRISGTLSSIDKLITAQYQEMEALKTHKKGLMQKLFPAREESI